MMRSTTYSLPTVVFFLLAHSGSRWHRQFLAIAQCFPFFSDRINGIDQSPRSISISPFIYFRNLWPNRNAVRNGLALQFDSIFDWELSLHFFRLSFSGNPISMCFCAREREKEKLGANQYNAFDTISWHAHESIRCANSDDKQQTQNRIKWFDRWTNAAKTVSVLSRMRRIGWMYWKAYWQCHLCGCHLKRMRDIRHSSVDKGQTPFEICRSESVLTRLLSQMEVNVIGVNRSGARSTDRMWIVFVHCETQVIKR